MKGDKTQPTIVSANDRAIQEIEALDDILPFYISERWCVVDRSVHRLVEANRWLLGFGGYNQGVHRS